MQERKSSDNALLFLILWFVVPLAVVLLIVALDLPGKLTTWLDTLW